MEKTVLLLLLVHVSLRLKIDWISIFDCKALKHEILKSSNMISSYLIWPNRCIGIRYVYFALYNLLQSFYFSQKSVSIWWLENYIVNHKKDSLKKLTCCFENLRKYPTVSMWWVTGSLNNFFQRKLAGKVWRLATSLHSASIKCIF